METACLKELIDTNPNRTVAKPYPVRKKTIYLPGLNGLRAIAAMAVVVSHITLSLGSFGLNAKIFGTDSEGNATGLLLAGYGVTIFFTLSGFLITYLLLKEKEVAAINVKNFYIRRALRIWPLYYLYLIISILVMIANNISCPPSSIWFFVFLAANIPFVLGNSLPLAAHYWSLGVEEQFYMFFPHLAKASNKKLLKISIGLIFFLVLCKLIFWGMDRYYQISLPFAFISAIRFHTMLIGVVGAILYYNNHELFIRIATHKVTQILSWLTILLIAINKFHFASVIDGDIVSVVTLCLIIGQVTKRNNLINLENRLFDFIGKISYGLYVIHPLLIFLLAKLIGHLNPNSAFSYLAVYCLVIGSSILIANLSYQFIEKRFLKLKAAFTTIRSSSSRGVESLSGFAPVRNKKVLQE